MTIKLYEKDHFFVRPFTIDDITDKYLSWFHDQEVTKYTSHGLFKYTKEQAVEYLENADKKGDLIWAIIAKERIEKDWIENFPNHVRITPHQSKKRLSSIVGSLYEDKHIGNIALQNINWIDRNAEFAGIIGNKEYWGKGIGTEAVRLLFEHGFNKLNLNKIYLGTAESNIGMKTIALKLGMKQEGTLITHVYLNGRYEDVLQYGILKSEWISNQKDKEKKI